MTDDKAALEARLAELQSVIDALRDDSSSASQEIDNELADVLSDFYAAIDDDCE